jgi:hypothetical protein
MNINSIYENQNLLSLYLVYFLVGLKTYQHPGIDIQQSDTTFHEGTERGRVVALHIL